MISIQAFMLIALGFLIAAFIGLLTVPAYRRRVERLTTGRIRRSMPLSEAEIRADKDRLRAENALVVHELEYKLEKATLAAARQRVEINRRDAAISALEGEVERLRSSLEEHENARHVLEQTIVDRLPKVEQRLAEARKLLIQRDRELAELTETARRQARSLEDASQVNAHTRDEVHRLTAALKVRSSRSRIGARGREDEDEASINLELETLRAKTRDQAEQIVRLEGLLARPDGSINTLASAAADRHERPDEVARLRQDLSEAEAALRAAQSSADAGRRRRDELDAEVQSLRASMGDQAAEIGQLKAELAVYKEAEKEDRSLAQSSKVAMNARIAALQAQTSDQEKKIRSLKAEIAAANERTARLAAEHTEEMRRLGLGRDVVRGQSLSEAERRKHSLADRIGRLSVSDARDEATSTGGDAGRGGHGRGGTEPASEPVIENGRKNSKVLDTSQSNGNGQVESPIGGGGRSERQPPETESKVGQGGEASLNLGAADKPSSEPEHRAGLLARITRLDRAE